MNPYIKIGTTSDTTGSIIDTTWIVPPHTYNQSGVGVRQQRNEGMITATIEQVANGFTIRINPDRTEHVGDLYIAAKVSDISGIIAAAIAAKKITEKNHE